MGFKPRTTTKVHAELFQEIYTVEVKYGDGTWHPGPPFYGLDTTTEYIGGHFTGSYERAVEHAKKVGKNRVPNTVRVRQFGACDYEVI